MAISYNNGMKLLAELNQCIADPYDPNELFQYDLDDGIYFQLANSPRIIEFLLVKGGDEERRKAKRVAMMLDTLLREGDKHMANEVLVGAIEVFTFASERPNLSTKAIADVMLPTLRAAYLEEMGESELGKEFE